VVHHDTDMDGILSGEIAVRALRSEGCDVECVGWDHGREVPATSGFHEVHVLDISAPEFLDKADSRVVWIDHHASAIERWDAKGRPGIRGVRIDGVAACRLAWWYYHHRDRPVTKENFIDRRVDEPALVTLVGEHDVFDHHDGATWKLHCALQAYTPGEIRSLCDEQLNPVLSGLLTRTSLERVLAQGEIIDRYKENESRRLGLTASTVEWMGLVWCFITAHGNSQLFRYAADERHDALLLARFDGRIGRWVVSLFPNPCKPLPFDERNSILGVAKMMGGGGHLGASGFRAAREWMTEFLKGLQPHG